jgi:ABC-2 type transport system ATP-binding protein
LSTNPIISTTALTKTYRRHKKEAGFAGSLKSLFKRQYEETKAVQQVNFQVEEGELVGFLGPNGAGKTTTLKMLSGLLHPTSGDAKVLGYTPWLRDDRFRRQFALVMGNKNQLWFDIPAMDSFKLNQQIYGVDEKSFKETVGELAALLGVEKLMDVQVRNLSLGERMKMELIASLIHRPRVLFLDEPTIGLDVVSQKAIREFLKEYNRKTRTTVILTSHYMEDIRALCPRVLLINQGTLMFDGPLNDLTAKYRRFKRLRVVFKEAVDKAGLMELGKVVEFENQILLLEVAEDRSTDAAREILTRYPVQDITVEEQPVDELVREWFEKTKK